MKKIIASIVAFVVPTMAFAQALAPVTNVNVLSSRILGIGNTIIYILVALSIVYIVYYVVQYMIKGSAEDKTTAAKNVGWGILGLFIIVSIWGLVNILTNTFSTTPTNQAIPNIGNNTQTGGFPANQVPIVR